MTLKGINHSPKKKKKNWENLQIPQTQLSMKFPER